MKRSKFLQKVFYNWQVKCICFLLAIFVYFMLTMALQETRTVTLPLEVKLPSNYTATSNIPDSIELNIKGTEDKIYMIDASKIKISADFSGVSAVGVSSIPVSIDVSELEKYLDVKGVSIYTTPSMIKIYFSETGK